jgi:hypothetical protein
VPSGFTERELSQLAAQDQGRVGKVGFIVAMAGRALRIEDNPRSEKFVNWDIVNFHVSAFCFRISNFLWKIPPLR